MQKNSKFSDWEVGSNYDCKKLLGKGSYGSVCLAEHKTTGKKVAIKKMEGVFEDETDCKRILREIILLRKLKHKHVVGLIDIILPADLETFDTLYIVLEHAESDIKKLVKSAIHLEMLHISTIVYNLLCAVKFMHSADVIHRDLKPANILINEDCTVKVCDFGLARSIAGIETAEVFIKKGKHQSDDDVSTSANDEEIFLKNTVPAKLHHKDEDIKEIQ
jgi:mitogen-activated protein kinase 1/3